MAPLTVADGTDMTVLFIVSAAVGGMSRPVPIPADMLSTLSVGPEVVRLLLSCDGRGKRQFSTVVIQCSTLLAEWSNCDLGNAHRRTTTGALGDFSATHQLWSVSRNTRG